MSQNQGFIHELSVAPYLTQGRTRWITAENPTGEKGQGGKAASNLGITRKGRPCITLPQGETVVLADIQGTGIHDRESTRRGYSRLLLSISLYACRFAP
ncbi:hypothetical protein QFZ81_001073 [Paenibacillus sp. V4I9]|uniref:hypothetical protein n=1 Tax=Paenibacillus sp. V4I9 TaxID=3042308 RepID=UPI002784D5ED|nr:hypothetical protein [Paenibacillus sp. V4I9]MDQ0885985.1 hypothetical protein [Paenibacillus sp. V4I9]